MARNYLVLGALAASLMTVVPSAHAAAPNYIKNFAIGTIFDPCTNENVNFSGDWVIKYTLQVQNGIAHLYSSWAAHSDGIGANSGNRYRIDFEQNVTENAKFSGYPVIASSVGKFRIVGQGNVGDAVGTVALTASLGPQPVISSTISGIVCQMQ